MFLTRITRVSIYDFFMTLGAHLAGDAATGAGPIRAMRSLCPNLNKLRLDQIQEAIRANQVSFPFAGSRVHQAFPRHAASAYGPAVLRAGLELRPIAQRYEVTRQHIWQIVSEWRRHAVSLGYLQVIPPPEALTPLRVATASYPLFRPVQAPDPAMVPAAAPDKAEAALALA